MVGTAARPGTAHVRIVNALARGLDARDYRLHCWFLGDDGPLAGELAHAGVEVAVLDWKGARDTAGTARFAWALRRRSFGIVHRHLGGRSVPMMVRMMTDARQIAHVHGVLSESENRLPVHGRRWSDRYIATSRAVAAQLPGRPVVVHPSAPVLAAAPGPPDGPPVVGVAGRLAPIKGIGDLLAALPAILEAHPSLRVEVAGEGPEHAALAAQARELGVEAAVGFLGWQPNLVPCYRRWSLFVQPSRYEGLGISALEAMGAGLPVVATDVGGLPEVVEDEVTGMLVPAAQPGALAAAILGMLDRPDRMRRMGEAGRQRVREKFSEDRLVRAIEQVYEDLV